MRQQLKIQSKSLNITYGEDDDDDGEKTSDNENNEDEYNPEEDSDYLKKRAEKKESSRAKISRTKAQSPRRISKGGFTVEFSS